MDYKEEYLLTIEQLFFKSRELEESQRREEKNLNVIESLRAIISDFDTKAEGLQGTRKESALNVTKKLIYIFNHIGKIYLDELAARKKSYLLQKDNQDLARIIEELKKEIELQKNINDF